ncbi:murein L,D-transpeptidase catalytic domain family protein [Aurantiacibacter sp. MUD11]|uniref:murein L,D-transpeptidase catalytic domain family protein n=1 Tax=Aurantiacibacter sp. MUD11 TaxID=3003265 RepID=UPI0022AA2E33|nr:murein L,D-transpeptidase catalytic domain family protein [Aurantiacibacter sp. MUD11]WAT18931.1 murein L,D-transpeptidase catalytic domain family protein [Aurantiacibacter sp. MUD11]
MKLNRRAFVGASLAVGSAAMFTPASLAKPAAGLSPASPLAPPPAAPAAQPTGVLGEALAALEQHGSSIVNRDRLGIADYTAHSGEFRFHIADIEGGEITKSFLVSHGRGSDPRNSGFVERFSNVPGSNASSRGSYVTGELYVGKHGRSRRLHGLEPENDRAFERAIVIHGADYVDIAMAENQGRVGRSLGCFAFERSEIENILELLGPGRLLYVAGENA